MIDYNSLSSEQRMFIQMALSGKNILVDACIGSGKTTAIQVLCNMLDLKKKVLYLTYNKLLKVDAKTKIKKQNILVTNYHGFCFLELKKIGVKTGLSDIIQEYNRRKPSPKNFDLLILDEYQDIEEEMGEVLTFLKKCNPQMQIIAVGDMAQKIYDKTRLNVPLFIDQLLDDYERIEFTQCFRLNEEWTKKLSNVWGKHIVGVNSQMQVKWMDFSEAFDFLSKREPREILCLGSNTGKRNAMLNWLENECSEKFNKKTVWSKITEKDGETTRPTSDTAIFTTYDGCKGMERDICVLFDWTESYWDTRLNKTNSRYEIIRNIFCVAASRAKKLLIVIREKDALRMRTMKVNKTNDRPLSDMNISEMFEFKYIEDIEAAFSKLTIKEISCAERAINIPTKDGLIDISSCVGIFQEAAYFTNYNIDEEIEAFFSIHEGKQYMNKKDYKEWPIDDKILYFVSLETEQDRYLHQVKTPIVRKEQRFELEDRLATRLPANCTVQVPCGIEFYEDDETAFSINGFADAVKDDIVYELKFVSELQHTHFLQCACYMVALGLKRGVLWNVRTNNAFEITVQDEDSFINSVFKAITKNQFER